MPVPAVVVPELQAGAAGPAEPPDPSTDEPVVLTPALAHTPGWTALVVSVCVTVRPGGGAGVGVVVVFSLLAGTFGGAVVAATRILAACALCCLIFAAFSCFDLLALR